MLPTWNEMSDLDKGAALLFLWKCEWESYEHAKAEYPCRYLEDPRLKALDEEKSCQHAVREGAGWYEDHIGGPEWERLYDLALDHR